MDSRHLAYRFELDPNDRQATTLARACGLARKVFNWGLAERQHQYETEIKPARERGEKIRSLSHFDQCKAWVAARAQVAPWASDFSAHIAEYALLDVDLAYRKFFSGLKAGRRVGFPRFKKYSEANSFRVRGIIKIEGNAVILPRLGALKLKGNPCRVTGIIKTATVSRRAGKWFVSLLVSQDFLSPTPSDKPTVGIDAGLKTSLTLSDGTVIQAPRPLLRSLHKLRGANKALARSQRNSAGRAKAKVHLARVHLRVANQRANWSHGVSDRLTKDYGQIVVENLAVQNLQHHKRHNGRSWADLGIAELYRQLEYKSAWRGVGFRQADRFYPSSQLCSGCGARQPMPLHLRVYDCPACGLSLDRDLNAALNLKSLAGMPSESLNARGGDVSLGSAQPTPLKREPSSDRDVFIS